MRDGARLEALDEDGALDDAVAEGLSVLSRCPTHRLLEALEGAKAMRESFLVARAWVAELERDGKAGDPVKLRAAKARVAAELARYAKARAAFSSALLHPFRVPE